MPVSRNGLTPDTLERVDELLRLAAAQGWSLEITSAKRTCEEQNRLYAQGRTAPGPIVTQAKGCYSWHVLGRAVDVAFAKGTPPNWPALGALGKQLGFRWGGDFPGFPDLGHFEYHPGQTIEQACPNPEECMDMPALGQWMDPGCGQGPRVRWIPATGEIELEGEGVVKQPLPPKVLSWAPDIHFFAKKHQVPAQLIGGVMALESRGEERANSGVAFGLMQLIPPTASHYAKRPVTAEELLDHPLLNLDLGTEYLGVLFKKYGGNPIKIGFSYNAGGVYCKAGCKKRENGECIERCLPNRFNILGDCVNPSSPNSFTVDYATRIIAYSNSALSEFPPPSSSPSSSSSSTPWISLVAGSLVGVMAGAFFLLPRRGAP